MLKLICISSNFLQFDDGAIAFVVVENRGFYFKTFFFLRVFALARELLSLISIIGNFIFAFPEISAFRLTWPNLPHSYFC